MSLNPVQAPCCGQTPLDVAPGSVEKVATPPSPSMFQGRLPSVRQLRDRFMARPIVRAENLEKEGGIYVFFDRTEEEHAKDKIELEAMLAEYNRQHEKSTGMLADLIGTAGFLEKNEFFNRTPFVVVADCHGDVLSLLGILDVLKEYNLFDENYRLIPHFHIYFLGDYMDRGENDIETLMLIIALQMENYGVHLLRGNHEYVDMNKVYSLERGWIEQNAAALSTFYKTLALARFVACVLGRQEKGGRREYMQLSHALFPPSIDPIGFLERGDPCMFVLKEPSSLKRLTALASKDTDGKLQRAARRILSAAERERRIHDVQQQSIVALGGVEEVSPYVEYIWSDPGESEGDCEPSIRGVAMKIPQDLIEAYTRMGGGRACVKALVHGHNHGFNEVIRPRGAKRPKGKVIATTLSVAAAGWRWKSGAICLSVPAVLITVAPAMKDWTKQAIYCSQKDFKMRLSQEKVAIFDSLPLPQ